jgi:hypothetical protein
MRGPLLSRMPNGVRQRIALADAVSKGRRAEDKPAGPFRSVSDRLTDIAGEMTTMGSGLAFVRFVFIAVHRRAG